MGAAVGLLLLLLLVPGRIVSRTGARTAPVGSDFERYHDHAFVVVKVVDGDTIDIDAPDAKYATTRLRLWGVDTPETSHSPQGEMYFGPQAFAFTRETLAGRSVRLELVESETRDKYDRLLAYVYENDSGEMFNEHLIREGFAYADTRFKHPYKEYFRELETQAKADGVGLWAHVTQDQMPHWRQRKSGR